MAGGVRQALRPVGAAAALLLAYAGGPAQASPTDEEHSLLLDAHARVNAMIALCPPSPITTRASRPTRYAASFAAFASPAARMSPAGLLSRAEPADDRAAPPGTSTNFRGEEVPAAEPYIVEDFESGETGRGWAFLVKATREDLGAYAVPTPSGITLNVRAEVGRHYEVRMTVYLIPPDGAEGLAGEGPDPDELNANRLVISLDGESALSIDPSSFRRMRGPAPVPRKPIRRLVRIPFRATHPVIEVAFTSADSADRPGWSTWGIDNIAVADPVQDPALGISGGEMYKPEVLGIVSQSAGMTGEVPPLPGNRYARPDLSLGGGDDSAASSAPRTRPPKNEGKDERRNEDHDRDDTPTDPADPSIVDSPGTPPDRHGPPPAPPTEVPAPSTVLVLSLALAAMNQRRR